MKKLVLAAILGLGVVGLNAENLSDEQTTQLIDDCLYNKNVSSCQRLVDGEYLKNVEQCDKENCNGIGLVYYTAENYQQALKYYKKACELNDEFGCYNLAGLYDQGLGVKQDFDKTFKLAKKACDSKHMAACYNVGVLYVKGKGVRQDFVNARKYFEKACNANNANEAMACNNLGSLYANGQGVKQNKSTAKKYAGKACDLGEQMGCDNYRILNEQGVK